MGVTTFFLKEGQNLNFALPGEWILDMAKRQAFGEPTRRADRIEDQATGQTETAHESGADHQSRRKEAERAIEEGDYKLALGMHHDIALYPRLAPSHVAVDRVFLLRHWLSDPVETDQKQVEEAARDFREATYLDPSLPNAHERLGTALSDLGDSDGALTELREALRLDPTMTAVHWSLSRALYKKGDLPAAIAEAREAVKSRPEDSVTHIHLGNLFDEAGDLKGEITEYYQALQLLQPDPRDGAYAIRYILAATIEKTGDPEGAVAQYRDLIRLYPQEPYVSGVHLALGKALYSKRDLPGALVEYKEALRLEPEYPEAHFELGRVLEDEGELDGAITEYNTASNSVWHDGKPGYGLIGNDFSARVDYHRGVSYARQGWLDSAAHNLRNAVRELPDNAQMHHDFGQVLERRGDKRRGDPESALAQYRLARDLEPANPQYRSDYERLARKLKR